MIPKYRFWHITEKKMYEVLSIHLMTGMVEVEGGKYFLIPQDGFLMEFTRLFDKNGVEIFEGDVVEVYGEKSLKVFFSHGAFCIDFMTNGTPLHAFGQNQLEVFGNIHEHPDLVEGT